MLIALSVVLNVAETIYFGCNSKPLTPAETICDGICSIILFAGFFVGIFDWVDYFWSKVRITSDGNKDVFASAKNMPAVAAYNYRQ